MKQYPYWKPAIILLVVIISALLVYPPRQKLKPGLDLAGGTVLLYQVDVPEDSNDKEVVEQTIASLRKRVDPNGVRNLIWRPVAGNRIEIQMAMPTSDAKQLRKDYLDQREKLVQGNLTRGSVAGILRLDDEKARAAAIANLAQGNQTRQAEITTLVELSNKLDAAKKAYQEYNLLMGEARDAQSKIPAAAADALAENKAHQEKLLNDFIPVTRRYNQATEAYAKAMDKLMATNLEPREVEHVLNLPPAPTKGTKAEESQADTSYREPALAKLLADHPERKDDIENITKSFDTYAKVKGALDDPNDLITLLRGSGVLEFRIAPATSIPEAEDYRQQLTDRGPRGGDQPYRWMRIDDPTSFAETTAMRAALEKDPAGFLANRGLIGQRYAGDYYILLSNLPQSTITQSKPDWEIANARAAADNNGFPAVSFSLNAQGAQYMGQLTSTHIGQPMAIVLDGRVISAPNINDRIAGSGIITGGQAGFSQKELQYLVRTFNAGSLQARLGDYPISIKTIGPGLGQDNLNHGLSAALYALVIIAVSMVIYYFVWGIIADIALAINILMILAAMSMLQATFTLPGIAGVVLTIGMAVDANVLILERIREELERKVDLKTAIRLGYEKAFSTIVDSNLTTLFICIILYYTASADVKGFGLTLGLGIVASMFTSLFFTHVVAELMVLANVRSAPMLPLVVPAIRNALHPAIRWMKYRNPLMAVSAVVVVISLGLIITRGSDMLDIEFRSGTQVSFDAKGDKHLSIKEVRSRLDQAAEKFDMPNLAGNRAAVVTLGDTRIEDGQVLSNSFSISTLNEDAKKVSNAVKDVFADVLETQSPITFMGVNVEGVADAPIRPVINATLGANIDRPTVTDDVTDAVGGVVVLLENLEPAASVEQLTARIQQVQLQAEFAQLGYRPFKVVGMDLAQNQTPGEATKFTSAAVVAYDNSTNYIEDPRSFTSDAQGLASTQWTLVRTAMQIDTSLASVSNFSSSVSKTMQQQAIVAMILSLLAVTAYVWLRFGKIIYGFGAILALAHDVIVTLGCVAFAELIYTSVFGQVLLLSDFKIDLSMIAALLTIVGYSLNDTIVVYDRIRENRGRLAYASAAVINDSINQTVSRTALTSGTTLISAFSLYILGGDGVHGFAFAMIVGVLVGTYSSNFVASPILLFIKAQESTRKHVVKTNADNAVV